MVSEKSPFRKYHCLLTFSSRREKRKKCEKEFHLSPPGYPPLTKIVEASRRTSKTSVDLCLIGTAIIQEVSKSIEQGFAQRISFLTSGLAPTTDDPELLRKRAGWAEKKTGIKARRAVMEVNRSI